MSPFDGNFEFIEPFIEHRGEKRGFWLRKPKAVGRSILLARKGSCVPPVREGETLIVLHFKTAFGTGGHGTTEGCLIALEKFVRGGERVLDVGTGTGILAIAARKLGAARVTAVDIDAAACREAKTNLAVNGIEEGVEVLQGGIDAAGGGYDIIAANLRTPVLVGILDQLFGKLAPSGIAILSGIMERELYPFLSLLVGFPARVVESQRIHGWLTLVLRHG